MTIGSKRGNVEGKLRRHEGYQRVLALLASVGIAPRVEYGGKHIKVMWEANGIKRLYTMALSPSDWRIPIKIACDVRRMLRQDGVAVASLAMCLALSKFVSVITVGTYGSYVGFMLAGGEAWFSRFP